MDREVKYLISNSSDQLVLVDKCNQSDMWWCRGRNCVALEYHGKSKEWGLLDSIVLEVEYLSNNNSDHLVLADSCNQLNKQEFQECMKLDFEFQAESMVGNL